MKIALTTEEVRRELRQWKREGLTVGLVPVGGGLHEGHASLIKRSVRQCGRTIVTICAAPGEAGTQFDQDRALCESLGADLLFRAESAALCAVHTVRVEPLDSPDCLREVCTAAARLFNIVQPDKAFFGEKDALRLAVIRRMARELCYGVEVVSCPTVREVDGLAVSRRNACLTPEERKAALCLSRAVTLGKRMALEGERDARVVVNAMKNLINHEPLARIDSIQAVDGVTLEPTGTIAPGVLLAVAVYLGENRLVDSFRVEQ